MSTEGGATLDLLVLPVIVVIRAQMRGSLYNYHNNYLALIGLSIMYKSCTIISGNVLHTYTSTYTYTHKHIHRTEFFTHKQTKSWKECLNSSPLFPSLPFSPFPLYPSLLHSEVATLEVVAAIEDYLIEDIRICTHYVGKLSG